MYDGGKIFAGVAIFLVLLTTPVWYNQGTGQAGFRPDPDLAPARAQSPKCIQDAQLMKTTHMQILVAWRDLVVREGVRTFKTDDGREFQMSLSNTCLKCHSNKADFCDRCHNYAAVTPVCWDCHLDPNAYPAAPAPGE